MTVETKKDCGRFNDWYEKVYLPKNVADVPTWSACRRYSSIAKETVRCLTLYEVLDERGMERSLELMRAPHRLGENHSWTRWDSGKNPIILWEDATRFRPIFHIRRAWL